MDVNSAFDVRLKTSYAPGDCYSETIFIFRNNERAGDVGIMTRVVRIGREADDLARSRHERTARNTIPTLVVNDHDAARDWVVPAEREFDNR